jgi:hypothetical protein
LIGKIQSDDDLFRANLVVADGVNQFISAA